MSSHFRQQELPKSPKATSNQTDDIQMGLSQLPPEMVREISSFCDVKAQFRLQLASREISSCLRKFCRRFFSQKFVDAEMFDSALLLDRFEAFGELEVYFEDGAAGLSAIAAINRSNLTYLDLTANFTIKAELKDAFYAAWAALLAASFRNLRTLVACDVEGSVPTSFLETILRCAPPSLTRLSLELGGSINPSTHLELAQRFQNARNVSLSLDYLAKMPLTELAGSLASVLELPFLEELAINHETCFNRTNDLLADDKSVLNHPFVKYFDDRGLKPKFDPVWVAWRKLGVQVPWTLLSICIDVDCTAEVELLLPRFAQLPNNNIGYSILLKQLDEFDAEQAYGWYRTLISHGMDLRFQQLERGELEWDPPEFGWIRLIMRRPELRFLRLLLVDEIAPGPDKTKITPLVALVCKLGYVPFCKPLLAHLAADDDLKHLTSWLWKARTQISYPALLPALGFDRPSDHINLDPTLDDEIFVDLLEKYNADPNQLDLAGLPLITTCSGSTKFRALLRHPRTILDGDLKGIPYPQEILDLCEVTPIDATALLKLSRSGVKIPTLARFIRESIYWLLASEDVGEAGVDAVLALFEFLPATIRSTMMTNAVCEGLFQHVRELSPEFRAFVVLAVHKFDQQNCIHVEARCMHEKGEGFVDFLIARGFADMLGAYLRPENREYLLPILKDCGMDNMPRWKTASSKDASVGACVSLLESFLSSIQ